MKIDWAKKLSSRKFWALITGVVTSVGAIIGLADNQVAQIVGLIGAVGSVIMYMLSEAYVDGQAAKSGQTK